MRNLVASLRRFEPIRVRWPAQLLAAFVLLMGMVVPATAGMPLAAEDARSVAFLRGKANIAQPLVDELAAGGPAPRVRVVVKGAASMRPFYRPVIDDAPHERRQALAAVRQLARGFPEAGEVLSNDSLGTLDLSLSPRLAEALTRNPHVVSIARVDGAYTQAGVDHSAGYGIVSIPPLHASGINGFGKTVAVVDLRFQSGSLGSAVVGEECFCSGGCCRNGTSRQSGPLASDSLDPVNSSAQVHGTRAAGIIARGGGGAAPGARLVLVRAPQLVDVFNALSWIATQPSIDVVSLSIGTGLHGGVCDTVPTAVQWLPSIAAVINSGKIVVAAAGNDNAVGSMMAPACLSPVISVAGSFACRFEPGVGGGKPLCVNGAPTANLDVRWTNDPSSPPPVEGSNVSANTSVFAPAGPYIHVPTPFFNPASAGTSWATPIVAGCAAMARQLSAPLSTNQFKGRVQFTKAMIAVGKTAYPRLNCQQALSALSGVVPNQHGLTGTWWRPSTSGQGFIIDIIRNPAIPGEATLAMGWYTYASDPAAPISANKQRWYTLSGTATGVPGAVPLTIYSSQGGSFASPPTINAVPVGTAQISFADCVNAQLMFQFNSGPSGSIALERITPNISCTPSGTPATINQDFLRSGAWYDPNTSGQGLFMELNPAVPVVFGGWYTYAPAGQSVPQPRQRWYTLQSLNGGYVPGNHLMSLGIFETVGGEFNTPVGPGNTPQTNQVGTASIQITSCTTLQLGYTFTGGSSAGLSGTLNLVRAGPAPAGCQ